jgi:hypothetical protein
MVGRGGSAGIRFGFFLLQHVALIVITIKITLNYFTAARFEEVPPHFII